MATITHKATACSVPSTTPHGLLERLLHIWGTARERRALADLDAHLLKDVGISPEQARTEANRAVWDVPSSWRR